MCERHRLVASCMCLTGARDRACNRVRALRRNRTRDPSPPGPTLQPRSQPARAVLILSQVSDQPSETAEQSRESPSVTRSHRGLIQGHTDLKTTFSPRSIHTPTQELYHHLVGRFSCFVRETRSCSSTHLSGCRGRACSACGASARCRKAAAGRGVGKRGEVVRFRGKRKRVSGKHCLDVR